MKARRGARANAVGSSPCRLADADGAILEPRLAARRQTIDSSWRSQLRLEIALAEYILIKLIRFSVLPKMDEGGVTD